MFKVRIVTKDRSFSGIDKTKVRKELCIGCGETKSFTLKIKKEC